MKRTDLTKYLHILVAECQFPLFLKKNILKWLRQFLLSIKHKVNSKQASKHTWCLK